MVMLASMRTSSKRTTAAVLRSIIGIKDWEMAKLLDCSISTIYSVESGRLKLSEALGTRMFHETGISLNWLLAGNPEAPPISERDEPYTRAIYTRAQAEKEGFNNRHADLLAMDEVGLCARVIAILEAANKNKNYFMVNYELSKALQVLELDQKLPSMHGKATSPKASVQLLKNVLARYKKLTEAVDAVRQYALKQSSSKRRRR